MPHEIQPPTIGELRDLASSSFELTTGSSPIVASYYRSLTPHQLQRPLTPENVGTFVRGENHAITRAQTLSTWQDRLAYFATPLRAPVAHLVAQSSVVGRQGHFADNEYAIEALFHHLSGTF